MKNRSWIALSLSILIVAATGAAALADERSDALATDTLVLEQFGHERAHELLKQRRPYERSRR